MRKKALIMVLCLCLLFGSTGCRKKVQSLKLSDIKEETILIRSDGTVQSGASEEFEEDYYSKKELEQFMNDTITRYNDRQDEERIKLSDFKIDSSNGKKTAKAIFTYDNIVTYSTFNGIDIKGYTMKEATEAGVLPAQFTVAADGSRVDQKDVTENSDYKVVIVKAKADITLPDVVKYYSDTMLLSSNKVETTEDDTAVIVYK